MHSITNSYITIFYGVDASWALRLFSNASFERGKKVQSKQRSLKFVQN